MNWNKLQEVVSWGQYLHWAQLNIDRWICSEEHTSAESIATSFQWFASMYVVIEGWEQLNLRDEKIDEILKVNKDGVVLLRRARNAVYHFQKNIYGEKMQDFANEFGRDAWVVKLYYEFIRFLAMYPGSVYPYEERKEEFINDFHNMLGWKPEYE